MNELTEMPWEELMNDRHEFRPGFLAIEREIKRRLAERDQLKAELATAKKEIARSSLHFGPRGNTSPTGQAGDGWPDTSKETKD